MLLEGSLLQAEAAIIQAPVHVRRHEVQDTGLNSYLISLLSPRCINTVAYPESPTVITKAALRGSNMQCSRPQAHILAHIYTEHTFTLLARLANLWTAVGVAGGGQGTEGSGDESFILCPEAPAFRKLPPRDRTLKPQTSQSLLLLSLAVVITTESWLYMHTKSPAS